MAQQILARPMKRPYLRAEERRLNLLRAAERIVERDGLGQLSMMAVAQEAHVSRQLVYRHFASRSELLVALVEYRFAIVDGDFSVERAALGDPRQLLRERFVRAMGMAPRDRLLLRTVFSGIEQLEPDLGTGVAELRRRLIDRWAGVGGEAFSADPAGRARVWALFQVVFGLWDLVAAGEIGEVGAIGVLDGLVDAMRDSMRVLR